MRSNILSKLIFASCVWYYDRAYFGLCVLIKDTGRRLPLQLQQCSYQGQLGDVRQSVRGNYKTRFWEGQNLTACTTFGLFVFFPGAFLSSRVIGACPYTSDLIIMRLDVRTTTTTNSLYVSTTPTRYFFSLDLADLYEKRQSTSATISMTS